ncbi:hypothetical protein DL96DRAFT_1825633 [Flagelloscypha sp. PMI_526]|nr:hypothetical protein DL96DRAFT_1825633 [Flagelloscypha sp. PMI_526]
MSALPLDILPGILDCLNFSTLKGCSSVNRQFHQSTQKLLFSHLVLNAWTWERKCQFLLSMAGKSRVAMVDKLTIEFEQLPIFEQNEVPPALVSLVVELGPQIRSLCLDGYIQSESRFVDDEGTLWLEISPTLRDCLCHHVIPSVTSLQLKEIRVPLFSLLNRCPHLRHLHIGSQYVQSTDDFNIDVVEVNSLPNTLDLVIQPFFEYDLAKTTSLAHFMQGSGRSIETLTVVPASSSTRCPGVPFLRPFIEMQRHLKHLRLGFKVYEFISESLSFPLQLTHGFTEHDLLPLASFVQLNTLTITIPDLSHKPTTDIFFSWLSAVISLAGNSLPETLTAVRFPLLPRLSRGVTFNATPHALDSLQQRCPFNLDFVLTSSKGNEGVEQAFNRVRATFPSWDNAGKLKLWVEVYRSQSLRTALG